MSDTQKSIVSGMTVLGISGFICKVVGALYKFPLAWIIGVGGLGTYQLVFPTYNLLLTISSAGIPVAISRMVSYSLAKDDPRSARRIFRIALLLLVVLGCITTVLMIAFSPQLALRTSDPDTQLGFVAIAPALLLVCIMSAFRGFMQGQQNMVPTAVSQLIEQVGKVVIILPMAYLGMRVSTGFAAAMVLLGNTIAEGIALLYMLLMYRRKRKSFESRAQDERAEVPETKTLIRRLLSLSIPITIGGCIIPLAGFVDSGMLLGRLMDSGMTLEAGKDMYGYYAGYVISLINVPTALSIAIAMSLVPAISGAMARKDMRTVRRQGTLGIRFAVLIGLPCSVGMSMLSKQILSMVYQFSSQEALTVTAELLSLSSITIVLFTVVQTTTGILQGMRKQRIPMYTLFLGVLVKIYLNYTLVGMQPVHIYGAPLASIACYTISMIPNLFYTYRYARMKIDIVNTLLRPLAATVGMGTILYFAIRFLPSGRLWTCVLITIGVAAYLGLARLTGAMTEEDIKPFRSRFQRRRKART